MAVVQVVMNVMDNKMEVKEETWVIRKEEKNYDMFNRIASLSTNDQCWCFGQEAIG